MPIGSVYYQLMTKTYLDRFGRVLIPKDVRRELGFKPDDELTVRVTRDGACLSLVSPRRTLSYQGRVLVFYGEVESNLPDLPWKT